ncbi:ATP-dependent DNA helicase PIF4-like [Senna tora]|uniref:ATP-dependent DNA helicase n=1 Tax=Senna tora TaxID=362788 RepID=A0A834SRL0_9FABA|nr:ATP-dependent DNA helicase PIF4-like [Senna tora]
MIGSCSKHNTAHCSHHLHQNKDLYNSIMDVVNHCEGGVSIVNGFGVASNGIASQLIPGGRTTYSRFVIPLDCNENSTFNIMQDSDLATVMIHAKLIIWNEALMAHSFCFETLDRALRDIVGKDNP